MNIKQIPRYAKKKIQACSKNKKLKVIKQIKITTYVQNAQNCSYIAPSW